jgi:hypothetical protein
MTRSDIWWFTLTALASFELASVFADLIRREAWLHAAELPVGVVLVILACREAYAKAPRNAPRPEAKTRPERGATP